ncbi:eCIS core domain-containing protein [Cellulomonas sp. FA1]|uniref:eCIS core domain-containing protein n=1 Tax=Cellulomonas sp. FA1 TaxID=1346710 RepID=UPI0009E3E20A
MTTSTTRLPDDFARPRGTRREDDTHLGGDTRPDGDARPAGDTCPRGDTRPDTRPGERTRPDDGAPLDPGVRRWLEDAYGADLGVVRVHTGARAARAATAAGGAAASRGTDVFLPDTLRPFTRAWEHVLAHEVAHTLQDPHRRRAHDEHEAETWTRLALAGGRLPHDATVRTPTGPGSSPHPTRRPALRAFNAWEHRLLGDLGTDALVTVATRGPGWREVVERQVRYLLLWQGGAHTATAAQIAAVDPSLTVVTLRSGLLATLGELNAVGGDFAADPTAIDGLPDGTTGGFLQQVRQESVNRLLHLLGDRHVVQFQGAIAPYAGDSTLELLKESRAIDEFTAGLGVDHYFGLLARNACHFAPFSWHRWRAFHAQARDLAEQAFAAGDPARKHDLTDRAWVAQAYADHFVEDSFAAGHLTNKTLIMQWFSRWAADQIVLPVPDWDMVRRVTADLQPALRGAELYDALADLTSHDPQTVEEQLDYRARVVASRVAPAGVPVEVAYRQYLSFLDAAVVQLSSNVVHNHYNEASLTVTSLDGGRFRVFGDEKLLDFGDAVAHPSAAVHLSQSAIRDLLERGTTTTTPDDVLRRLPTGVATPAGDRTLEAWHDDALRRTVERDMFDSLWSRLKEFVTIVSPRMGLISRDQRTSGLVTAWQTSLPGSGYTDVQPLFDGTRAFAASNGHVYRLDPGDGHVLAHNSLPGRGNHETRVASDGTRVYAGIDGYVVAMEADGLRTQWQASLPGSGYAVTSVMVAQDGAVYAASNGHVYRLEPGTGHVLAHNPLPGRGREEVRLTLTRGTLAAGTNGYVVGLAPGDLATRWQTSLPGAGWDVVDVAGVEAGVLVGSNGHVYVLDPGDGRVLAHNGLSGLGHHRVDVASAGDAAFVGTAGRTLGLALAGLGERWGRDLSIATGKVVRVLAQNGWLFAAVNGYLYQLDPATGAVLYTNDLAGRGFHDVQLASDGVTVYCGIDGYVVGVRPDPR